MQRDSRTIGKFFKKKESKNISIEFLDHLRPNTFEMSKTGRIQTSSYGTYSHILAKAISFDKNVKNSFKGIAHPIYPDKMGVLSEKIMNENYRIFKDPVDKKGFEDRIGFLETTIYTDKVKGTKFEASIINIYMDDERSFVIKIEKGTSSLTKDEFNRNDIAEDYSKDFGIALRVPINEMELLAYQVKEFLRGYNLIMMGPMLAGRSTYERNCQTIFKECKGDTEKIREIEIKLNQLSESDKELALSGQKKI